MKETIDLTACITKGSIIKIEEKEYEIRFNFRTLHALEEIYGNIGAALDSMAKQNNLYEDILNFLYAALGEKYKLKKTDIEEWITISSAPILYSILAEEIFNGIGMNGNDNNSGEM